MAELKIDGPDLVVVMSGTEKLEALHTDVRVPVGAVTDVRTVETAWPELRGIRAPGTGVPGVVAVGTRRGSFGKDFVVVHGKGPAIVTDLEGAEYGRIVVTDDNAEATAAGLRSAVGSRS